MGSVSQELFERTIVQMCVEQGYQDTMTATEIDCIVCAMCEGFPCVVEEFGTLLELGRWDEIVSLAARERTMRALRGTR